MLVVVGGQRRKVGKTSVVEALIRAIPEARWTALKITHGHPHAGQDAGAGDSGRYLRAGAVRSELIEVEPGGLQHAVPRVRELLAAGENVICESNSILEFIDPDLYLFVSDPADPEMKESARRFLDRADAILRPPEYVTGELVALVRELLRRNSFSYN